MSFFQVYHCVVLLFLNRKDVDEFNVFLHICQSLTFLPSLAQRTVVLHLSSHCGLSELSLEVKCCCELRHFAHQINLSKYRCVCVLMSVWRLAVFHGVKLVALHAKLIKKARTFRA